MCNHCDFHRKRAYYHHEMAMAATLAEVRIAHREMAALHEAQLKSFERIHTGDADRRERP